MKRRNPASQSLLVSAARSAAAPDGFVYIACDVKHQATNGFELQSLLLGFCAKRNPETSGKQDVILLIAKYRLAIVTIIEKKISRHPPVQLRCDTKVSGDPILAVFV